jgi:oligopeptide/dipeptide ABC transporter ATP-binding protein
MLQVKNLKTQFKTQYKNQTANVLAVDNVSFSLQQGQTLALVGESGCGKSVTALSLMNLIPAPGKIIGGEVLFNQQNLLALSDRELQQIRGKKISMIFQEPSSALNPVLTCGHQISQVLKLHFSDLSKQQIAERTFSMLKKVGISSPETRMKEYPHQLSGGMKQRIMIAMSLICQPEILIADEPTTALDVTIQAQILDIIKQLQQQYKTSLLLITHDLGVVSEMADQVLVMYAGKVVESNSAKNIFTEPKHPYTKGLLKSVLGLENFDIHDRCRRLPAIRGMVPSLENLPQGCRFSDRCDYAQAQCQQRQPEWQATENENSGFSCFYPESVR